MSLATEQKALMDDSRRLWIGDSELIILSHKVSDRGYDEVLTVEDGWTITNQQDGPSTLLIVESDAATESILGNIKNGAVAIDSRVYKPKAAGIVAPLGDGLRTWSYDIAPTGETI